MDGGLKEEKVEVMVVQACDIFKNVTNVTDFENNVKESLLTFSKLGLDNFLPIERHELYDSLF